MGSNWKVNDAGTIATGDPNITLDKAFDKGKIIDGADSEANAVQIGDATNKWLMWIDGNGSTQYKNTKTGYKIIEGGEISFTGYLSESNVTYRKVKIIECFGINSTAANVTLDNCIIDYGTQSSYHQFFIDSSLNVTIQNCKFNLVYTGSDTGGVRGLVNAVSDSNISILNNKISLTANSLNTNIYAGLILGNNCHAHNNVINVTATASGGEAYGIVISGPNCTISNNIITVDRGAATSGYGHAIRYWQGSSSTATGNVMICKGTNAGVTRGIMFGTTTYTATVGNTCHGLNFATSGGGTGVITANNAVDTSAA